MAKGTVVMAVTGLIALSLAGVLIQDDEVFTLGVTPGGVAATLRPTETLCQQAVEAPPGTTPATGAVLTAAALKGRPSEVVVRIGQARGVARVIASSPREVRVSLGRSVDLTRPRPVCIRNLGPGSVDLVGNAGVASRTSTAVVGRRDLGTDLSLRFTGAPTSWWAAYSGLLTRASLWRPEWVGAWTYWVLTTVVLIGGCLLLRDVLRQRRPEPRLSSANRGVPGPGADPREPCL